MTVFTLKLGGVPLEVAVKYDTTLTYYTDYLSEEAPLFHVDVTQEHIEIIRVQDRKTAIAEGRSPLDEDDRYLEVMALAYAVMDKLLDYGIMMFHGSVLAENGRAYMFTAKSGTGKTTHSRLWLKNFPDCHILNGDKPLLCFREDGIYVSGSPWRGKEKYGVKETLPLEAICILERDTANHIEEIPMKDAFDTLVRQIHIPDGTGSFLTALNLIKRFSALKLYRLGCNMEDEAAIVSHTIVRK